MVAATSNARAKEFINSVLCDFYRQAVSDFLIGYQFRKIKEAAETTFEDIFFPELEAFSSHLARIEAFWLIQLLGEKRPENEPPFDLIAAHSYLNIKRGELSRWVFLFKQTLEANRVRAIRETPHDAHEINTLSERWLLKVELFRDRMERNLLGARDDH